MKMVWSAVVGLVLGVSMVSAQQPGQVLFSRGADTDAKPAAVSGPPDHEPATPVTNAERSSVAILATDLDLHLVPATAGLEAHAILTVKNIGNAPLKRIPLQLSSTLRFESIATNSASGVKAAMFTESPIATDADHTGYAEEAVVTPATPLAAGDTLRLTVLYGGTIHPSAARLELLGTPPEKAALADWDAISADGTVLRGFGDVLWYPVAAPTALLGDGNKLFAAIGEQRLRTADNTATLHLRLTVEYVGEAPSAAILNGRTELLTKIDDTQDSTIAETHGLATADFAERPIGFRSPNLFVTAEPSRDVADQLLAVVTEVPDRAEPIADAAALVHPLVMDWLGSTQTSPLTVIDHPGQSFEDDALLVAPLDASANPDVLAPQAAYGLAHAWFHSVHPWLDEGVAEFVNLLWTEQKLGRDAVVAKLQQQAALVALAEPELDSKAERSWSSQTSPEGAEPLIHASSEVFYRSKAAAVLWMLRGIVGDDQVKLALKDYRHAEALSPTFDNDPRAFQRAVEKASKRDLAWFFDDWVNHDRSLPDLNIVSVVPHPLPSRAGLNDGYLVAVEVHNDGEAVAEVPVTVRSGTYTATERIRIPGGGTASTRIVFNGIPDVVQVNDGTTPELRASIHTRQVQIKFEK